MQLNEKSLQSEDWLTQFLCPVVTESFYFQKSKFSLDDLLLETKSTIEISHSMSHPKVDLSKEDLVKLEKIDPLHKILNHVMDCLLD